MRRNYGSRLFELIDAPLNSATSLLMSAATAGALAKWVPEILLSRVTYSLNPDNTGLIANIRSQRLDVPDTPLNLALPIPFK
jgi:phage baseplate assembly protein W